MEKAKAIAHVKDMYAHMLFREDKEALETLIPELHESEDERIRKYLIEELKAAKSIGELKFTIPQPTREECIAWLEKQKESPKKELGKYSEEEELAYRLNWVMQDYYKAGKDDEEKEHRFKCYNLFWDALEDENFFEQKEQKTAGWSEDDEENINNISEIIEHCIAIPYSGGTLKLSQEYKKELQCFLKSLRPQPKQEWTEEDKDMLNSCISSIEEAKENRYAYKETDGDTSYDHEIDWLKSLPERFNLTPKQEWTEEDSINLNSILNHLKEYLTNGAYTYYESWLKSLRPSWKPSEEQMKALQNAVTLAAGNKMLAGLYEQLKQL